MKSLFAQLAMLRDNRARGRNLRFFVAILGALLALIVLFMILFRAIMALEGQEHSWITAFYWVLTVMSTLGFGDVAFESDLGRVFSMVVLLAGMFLLLVLLPFLFIEMFYIPWSSARERRRVPRALDDDVSGHVLVSNLSVAVETLQRKLEPRKIPSYLVVSDPEEALRLYDLGWNVLQGDHDLPETWLRAGVERASLVAATGKDAHNVHVTFTVREVNETVPIVAIAQEEESVDVLELAGANEVFRLSERLGVALARRVTGIDTVSHPIGKIEGLVIAEASVRDTDLVNKTLRENNLRPRIGVSVVGLWEHGKFVPAAADAVVKEDSVLVLVGTSEQLRRYDEEYGKSERAEVPPALILGGGRVGRAVARTLKKGGLDYRIIEKVKGRVPSDDAERTFVGNAADFLTLSKAGIERAPAIIVTTHDDDTNVFLTLYCRKLRPDVQILSRSTRSRNVQTLYRAGADVVLSYATMGADAIYNLMDSSEVLTIAEGLSVFRFDMPECLWGKTLAESQLRPKTGASVIAVESEGGRELNPDPQKPLPKDSCLVLIGDSSAEERFVEKFVTGHG